MNLNSSSLKHVYIKGLFWFCVLLSLSLLWFKLYIFAVIGLAVLIWSRCIEPYRVTIKKYTLHLSGAEPSRVVFLSDFHAGSGKGKKWFELLIKKVNALKPDLVLLGGDFVEEYAASLDELSSISQVKAKNGVGFILGNHDFLDRPDRVRMKLESWGVMCLENKKHDWNGVEIIGLQDAWFGLPDMALMQEKKVKARIILMHEPDGLLDIEEGQADLILLGHTHGGQVRLPVLGAVPKLPQAVPQSLDRGFKIWKQIPVIISQGLGESTGKLRLFCPPEIVLIELK